MEPAFADCSERPGLLRAFSLSQDVLQQFLLSGQFICLMILNAIDRAASRHIVRRITNSEQLTGYEVEPTFKKVGRAWFDNMTDQERAQHLARTIEYTKNTRALCAPFPAPTDIVKLDLDLNWRPGAFNLRIGGRPLYLGLPRALPPGGAVQAHYDWIGDDSPGAPGIEDLQRQYALNIYLQTADSGGELALWDTQMKPDKLKTLRLANHAYALDEAKLGKPALVIRPEEDSLVFFDATRPHAVREARGTRPRVTFSTFMGFSGPDRPLTLWS